MTNRKVLESKDGRFLNDFLGDTNKYLSLEEIFLTPDGEKRYEDYTVDPFIQWTDDPSGRSSVLSYDATGYLRIYDTAMEAMLNTTPKEWQLLMFLTTQMNAINKVYFNYNTQAGRVGDMSVSTCTAAINNLLKKGFLLDCVDKYFFWVNPYYISKLDRNFLFKDYTAQVLNIYLMKPEEESWGIDLENPFPERINVLRAFSALTKEKRDAVMEQVINYCKFRSSIFWTTQL